MKRRLGLLMTILLLVLFGCSEYESVTNAGSRGEIKTKEVKLTDITNQRVLDKILNPHARGISSADTSNRPIYDSINNFSVDPEHGVYIEQDEYHSYTFKVLRDRPTPGLLENLVVSHIGDDKYESILLQYKITDAEIQAMKEGQIVDMDGKITKISLEESEIVEDIVGKHHFLGQCYEISFMWVDFWCPSGEHSSHNYGGCSYYAEGSWTPGGTYMSYHQLVPCDIGGGGSPPNPGGVPTSLGSFGGVLTTINDANDIVRDRQEAFMEQLTEEQEECMDSLSIQNVRNLMKYVGSFPAFIDINTIGAIDPYSFAENALAALCENPDTKVDYQNKIIIDPSFSNNAKADCVYGKISPLSNFANTVNTVFGSASNSSVLIKIAPNPLPGGEDAVTIPNYPVIAAPTSKYEIVFDPTFVSNASTIEIALTLFHEMIHAELIERCLRLGLITHMGYNNQYQAIFQINGTLVNSSSPDLIPQLIYKYRNYTNGPTEWNHNLMTALNYHTTIKNDLIAMYPILNDANADFINTINMLPQNTFGNFTIADAMGYISWIGLEATDAYQTTIQSSTTETQKKNFISNVARTHFTHNCTP